MTPSNSRIFGIVDVESPHQLRLIPWWSIVPFHINQSELQLYSLIIIKTSFFFILLPVHVLQTYKNIQKYPHAACNSFLRRMEIQTNPCRSSSSGRRRRMEGLQDETRYHSAAGRMDTCCSHMEQLGIIRGDSNRNQYTYLGWSQIWPNFTICLVISRRYLSIHWTVHVSYRCYWSTCHAKCYWTARAIARCWRNAYKLWRSCT